MLLNSSGFEKSPRNLSSGGQSKDFLFLSEYLKWVQKEN